MWLPLVLLLILLLDTLLLLGVVAVLIRRGF